jgi:hypothetical protein
MAEEPLLALVQKRHHQHTLILDGRMDMHTTIQCSARHQFIPLEEMGSHCVLILLSGVIHMDKLRHVLHL